MKKSAVEQARALPRKFKRHTTSTERELALAYIRQEVTLTQCAHVLNGGRPTAATASRLLRALAWMVDHGQIQITTKEG